MTTKRGLGIEEIISNKREDIVRLATKHGAFDVRVFGSVARGEADLDSDLDLLVNWDYEHISPWGGVELDMELEALLGRKVDVVSEKGLYWYIRDRVLKEAIPL